MNFIFIKRISDIIGLIAALVFVVSFLNINIMLNDDNITSVWCYIWKPHIRYIPMAIAAYLGILFIFITHIPKLNKRHFKSAMLLYTGIALLWIIVLCFSTAIWHLQRDSLLNYQYIFVLTTLYLILNKSVFIKYIDTKIK